MSNYDGRKFWSENLKTDEVFLKGSEALSERRLSFGSATIVNSFLLTISTLRMATKRHDICIM